MLRFADDSGGAFLQALSAHTYRPNSAKVAYLVARHERTSQKLMEDRDLEHLASIISLTNKDQSSSVFEASWKTLP